jgi:hypothetical protein
VGVADTADRLKVGRVIACLVLSLSAVALAPSRAGAVGGSGLVSLTPARLLDTRPGSPTVDGAAAGTGRLAGGQTLTLGVIGRGGVAGNAVAVMLNVTAVSPDADGFVTVFPCGSGQPLASNLNFAPGDVVANAVFAKLGTNGTVCLYTSTTVDLVVDVDGYATADGPRPIVPARFLDTRPDGRTIDDLAARGGRLAGGSTVTLAVGGRTGVPAYAASVFLNVTVVAPAGPGFLTVFPCGQDRPNASNLNFGGGEIVPNAVVAKLGSFGYVCIYASATTDVVVDVDGYAIPGGPVPVAPARLLDTRPGFATVDGAAAGVGRVAGGTALWLSVAGRGGVPRNADSVLLNVTAVSPDRPGYVTVYPCNVGAPTASNLNYVPGDVVPNAVFAKLDPNGRVCFYVQSSVDLVVDVDGYSTRYDAGRWSHPTVGGWEYDGDQDGNAEEAWLNNDADDAYDAYAFDVDDDGRIDWVAVDRFNSPAVDTWLDETRDAGRLLYFDLDEDGHHELILYDGNRDDYAEIAFGDNDGDGLFEAAIADPGQDGTFERYARDTDGDGQIDTWFTVPTPASTLPRQQPSLGDFYRTFAANVVTFNPVYAGGVSAFHNYLGAYDLSFSG